MYMSEKIAAEQEVDLADGRRKLPNGRPDHSLNDPHLPEASGTDWASQTGLAFTGKTQEAEPAH
jgi:hypothetical protein